MFWDSLPTFFALLVDEESSKERPIVSVDFAKMQLIFLAAVERHRPEDWQAYLDQACGADDELRHQVGLLLQAHQEAGSVPRAAVDEPDQTGANQAQTERPGTVIGPYKLIEPIGEGGMGTVWMAQQTEPVKRVVALKLIRAGMDSKQVITRFEAERQALALMDHPNIAKVLDARATSAGRPYFVMDLVKGVPITQYCDQNRLTPRQRLELFIPVCQAIQHAHQKGVIHRDLKPSNVLVALADGKPVPKIIDFGVAKAAGQSLTDKTLVTGFGNIVGTLEYMSPEQAEINQLDIDTRSDIYSLGVLLYELLTGSPPFSRNELEKAGLLEILRVIREQEPTKPSTKVRTAEGLPTLAANRGTEPAKLTKLLRGELDWIVMKALEKDRNCRYESASTLAADVQRYLNDEPVLACPPSGWYQLRKFARRNKQGLAMVALLGVMMLTVAGILGWADRDRAARQAGLEGEVALALDETEKSYRSGKLPEALAELKRAEGLLASGVRSEKLRQRVGRWRADLEMVAELERIRLERATFKDGVFDAPSAVPAYRAAFLRYGLDLAVLEMEEAAARIRAAAVRDALVAALDDWAQFETKAGRPGREFVNAIARQADPDPWRERLRTVIQRSDWEALEAMAQDKQVLALPPASVVQLAAALSRAHRSPLAVEVLRQAQRRHEGDFWINHELGYYLKNSKPARPGEAVGYYRAAMALRPGNPGVHLNVGNTLLAQGDWSAAEAEFREALRLQSDYADAHNSLGCALQDKRLLDEAIAEFREAIRIKKDSAQAHHHLGIALGLNGQPDKAIAEFREAIRIKKDFAAGHNSLGIALKRVGRLEAAVTEYREAIRIRKDYASPHYNLGILLEAKGQLDDAIAEYRAAIQIKPDFLDAHINLGSVLLDKGDRNAASAACEEAIRLKPDYAQAHVTLGRVMSVKGDPYGAIAEYRLALRLKPELAVAHYNLGNALGAKGDRDGAIAEYREVIRLRPDYAEAYVNLGAQLRHKGELDTAVDAYRNAIRFKPDLAKAHINLGEALWRKKDRVGAIAAWKEAVRLEPNSYENQLVLAWYLASSPDPQPGDARTALEAAQRAVEHAPPSDRNGQALARQALGWARYRAGEFKASIEALEKSCAIQENSKGGCAFQWFFLAMAHWQLGHQDEARKWHDRAAEWMDRHAAKDQELQGFRAEAAALLKIGEKSETKPEAK
jgi:tetratricopeptide (TPR) repeat protein/serine/threonine protein kinase